MNSRTSAARRTPSERTRAVGRVRTLTIGAGLAGVAAVGGFAALSAATYDGTPADTVTTAALTASTATSTTTSATDSSSISAAAAPTTTTGTAHAATGSS